jgi:hypothetical protein
MVRKNVYVLFIISESMEVVPTFPPAQQSPPGTDDRAERRTGDRS